MASLESLELAQYSIEKLEVGVTAHFDWSVVPRNKVPLACVLRLMARDKYDLGGRGEDTEAPFLFLATGVVRRAADYGITLTW
jgi:hypothetical protein